MKCYKRFRGRGVCKGELELTGMGMESWMNPLYLYECEKCGCKYEHYQRGSNGVWRRP